MPAHSWAVKPAWRTNALMLGAAEEGSRESVDAKCRRLTATWVREKHVSDQDIEVCDFFEQLERAGLPSAVLAFVLCSMHRRHPHVYNPVGTLLSRKALCKSGCHYFSFCMLFIQLTVSLTLANQVFTLFKQPESTGLPCSGLLLWRS